MITHTATTAATPRPGCSPAQRVTRSLLGYGVLAGVVFEVSILIQGLTRHGFRLAHDDASLLGNGPLGWIQIATFLVSGAMTIACAAGARRALASPPAGRWGPLLIGVYGAALMAAGLLRADPADGFGPGAPAGQAAHISWHAAGHLAAASIGFSALIGACFVVARYFSREQRRGLAYTRASPGWPSWPPSPASPRARVPAAIVLPFYGGVLIAWIWIAVTSVHLYRRASEPQAPLTSTRGHRTDDQKQEKHDALHDAAVRRQPLHAPAARAVRGDHEAGRRGHRGGRPARHRRPAAQRGRGPGRRWLVASSR